MNHPDDDISLAVAARLAQVSIKTLRTWIARQWIMALDGFKPARISLCDLERLLDTYFTPEDVLDASREAAHNRRERPPTPRGKPPLYAPLTHTFHPDREAPHARG